MNEQVAAALLGQDMKRLSGPAMRPCSLTRANGPIFYALGAAFLLTVRACAYHRGGAADFSTEPEFSAWLLNEWMPQRTARVQRLREYLTMTWPELDWGAAAERFSTLVEKNAAVPGPCLTRRALEHCTAASQSAVFFRCLARWADDVRLRTLAERIAEEEAQAFSRFRALHASASKKRRLGMRNSWRTVRQAMRGARDVHVQSAFDSLSAQWGPNAPFPGITYPELTRRVCAAVNAHVALSWPERLLFRPWHEKPRPLAFDIKPTAQRGFRSVVAAEPQTMEVRTGAQRWAP